MKDLKFPADFELIRGKWKTSADIKVTNVAIRDIYHAPVEPGFVAWAILWKEKSGDVKLSFTEAAGSLDSWPPTYDFNSYDIEYYLKTLVTKDNGKTWTDTGWREDLDDIWERNSDHHIRHVFELPDGTLCRNYCHSIEGLTYKGPGHIYDASKEGSAFPFGNCPAPVDLHLKVGSIWTSGDGGKNWEEICVFDKGALRFFVSGIGILKDGTLLAMGTVRDSAVSADQSTWTSALAESKDNGKTWSEPVVVAENDDKLNPQGFCDECDFVELDDSRVLVIYRTSPGCFRQQYIERDSAGKWQIGPALINHKFPPSGYPHMHRTCDGTIFYYSIPAIMYSCDDGATWSKLDLGFSYYGQLVESTPGHILAISQKNMGDCPFPWKHDSTMMQTSFDFERINVPSQEDVDIKNALAKLNVGEPKDFHIALELKADGASGIAYNVTDENNYRFTALTIPANETRLPADAPRVPQNVFLQIGKVENGQMSVQRKECVGKVLPGSWFEFQLSRENGLLKAACNIASDPNWSNTYSCFKDESSTTGAIALFCNKSTGSFRNIRFGTSAELIRNNWIVNTGDSAKRIALDAGREEE